ncbi:MAG: efflux RND transporter periplasmic adaptor subunit [Myxococcales bacterium]|nr:efflux RND transporter periplasmic adaptor subunit [Myxococcales bacterium]
MTRYDTLGLALLVAFSAFGCWRAPAGSEEHDHRGDDDRERHGTKQRRGPDGGDEGDHEHHKQKTRLVHLAPAAIVSLRLETAPVAERRVAQRLRLKGQIEFDRNALVHVSPRVASRVVKVHKLLGEDVEKGEILAELDSIPLGELKLRFLEARTELQLAATVLARQQRLHKSRITSERELLRARSAHARARMRLQGAHEMLHLYGLTDSEIRTIRYGAHQPSRIALRAPIGGRIIHKRLAPGELIKPGDKAYIVADLRSVWAQVDITEGDLAKVRRGMRARVFARAYPGHWFAGELSLISSSADPQTRTLVGRIVVKNRTVGSRRFPLRDKMYIEVELSLGADDGGPRQLVVPETAIQRYRDGYIAFVEREPGTYEVRPVTLGGRFGGRVAVTGGLRLAERVVTVGTFVLKSEYAKNQLGGGHSH